MDTVDEEVDPEVKLQFILLAQQCKESHKLNPLTLGEMGEQFFLVVFIGDLVVLVGGLEAII